MTTFGKIGYKDVSPLNVNRVDERARASLTDSRAFRWPRWRGAEGERKEILSLTHKMNNKQG